MYRNILLVIAIVFVSSLGYTQGSTRVPGEIIKDYGSTARVSHPEIITDTTAELKLMLDVSKSSEDKSSINRSIVTVARFLNMHANAGMKIEQLSAAVTIHGGAWQDVLNDEEYKKKFGIDNPNTDLINQLNAAGVDVIVCGQTAAFRGMSRDDVNPNVKFALSAMTAILQYQNNGYHLIKF